MPGKQMRSRWRGAADPAAEETRGLAERSCGRARRQPWSWSSGAAKSQTLGPAEADELYQQVRPPGQGRFGRVLLVTHRQEGAAPAPERLPEASWASSARASQWAASALASSQQSPPAPDGACPHGDLVTLMQPTVASAEGVRAPRRVPGAPGYRPGTRCCAPARGQVRCRAPGSRLRLAAPPELCPPPGPAHPACAGSCPSAPSLAPSPGASPWPRTSSRGRRPAPRGPSPALVGPDAAAAGLLWGCWSLTPRTGPLSSIRGYLGRPWRRREEEAEEGEEGAGGGCRVGGTARAHLGWGDSGGEPGGPYLLRSPPPS
ncbi:serine/threonine-protein kinase SBK2-like [Vulpes lagopus]|uniref:serine/threonine-protein kinase SBK2-like n=1 Tax=Vulpes lagopus TaxID=494514 RepID=UPI001BC9688B|nr:serine/threonine-protein kinase SBK2-like [Vulpes lagopus]